jgi:hypothetical protein
MKIAGHFSAQIYIERSIKEMMSLPEVRDLLAGPDAREGPSAFAEKRPPRWADPR